MSCKEQLVSFFLQLLINGISIGFLYGLSAMGFVMIFKSSSVLNFAHGELLAIGAFFFLALVTWAQLPISIAFLVTLFGRTPDFRHHAHCRPGFNAQGADAPRMGRKSANLP
jgi:hypothetical protein